MFGKELLLASAEMSPYPGYTEALLTVGYNLYLENEGNDGEGGPVLVYYCRYGFLINTIGSLTPALNYTQLYINYPKSSPSFCRVYVSRPVYINGTLYNNTIQTTKLTALFQNSVGKTIKVYLQNQ